MKFFVTLGFHPTVSLGDTQPLQEYAAWLNDSFKRLRTREEVTLYANTPPSTRSDDPLQVTLCNRTGFDGIVQEVSLLRETICSPSQEHGLPPLRLASLSVKAEGGLDLTALVKSLEAKFNLTVQGVEPVACPV
ncbi:MAG TPA: hypothetical protein VLA04_03820 [Verrucomicrobiae bacterium]|nr:hypothetical protein [Verrucomicrobiae bacterium]